MFRPAVQFRHSLCKQKTADKAKCNDMKKWVEVEAEVFSGIKEHFLTTISKFNLLEIALLNTTLHKEWWFYSFPFFCLLNCIVLIFLQTYCWLLDAVPCYATPYHANALVHHIRWLWFWRLLMPEKQKLLLLMMMIIWKSEHREM